MSSKRNGSYKGAKPAPIAKPVQNSKATQKKHDKSLWMRIIVLALAGIMILGAILLPLL